MWDALQTIVDPELSASLVDLAMIRAVTVDGATTTVELVLTAPSGPLAEGLAEQVRQAVLQRPRIQVVDGCIVGMPWQRWLDEAPDKDEHGGDAAAQNPLPQHFDM